MRGSQCIFALPAVYQLILDRLNAYSYLVFQTVIVLEYYKQNRVVIIKILTL